MPKEIREVISERIIFPEKIIEDVGDRLHRTVMPGIFAREKVMTKGFEDEERASD